MDLSFEWKGNKVIYRPHDRVRKKAERRRNYEERLPFEIDRSRIVHSAAFRRLQGKTQVFTTGEGDFFRTRLTHSIEVAQIGKGLALRLKADSYLVEAICLVHDIGHPPFGHAGEEELKRLMRPFGGFEANAQNIRILTRLESKSEKHGLNLTRAAIDGQLKYKQAFPLNQKKFIYEDDIETLAWASKEAQSNIKGSSEEWQSFECQIMDWADEVAYAVHDLEDSIHAGIVRASTFVHQFPTKRSVQELEEKFDLTPSEIRRLWDDLINECAKVDPDLRVLGAASNYGQRKINRKKLTSFLIGRYIKSTGREIRGDLIDEKGSQRYMYKLRVPPKHKVEVALINKLIMEFVIGSPQIRTLEEKGKHIIKSLFEKFMEDKRAEYLFPEDWQERLLEVDCDCERCKARVVSDYISGMTDWFAQKTYARLFLPNQGSIYDQL